MRSRRTAHMVLSVVHSQNHKPLLMPTKLCPTLMLIHTFHPLNFIRFKVILLIDGLGSSIWRLLLLKSF